MISSKHVLVSRRLYRVLQRQHGAQRCRQTSTQSKAQAASDGSTTESWLQSLLKPIQFYGRHQQRRPYITQISTLTAVFFIGDLSAQSVSSQAFKTQDYEPIRGLRSALIGAIWAIPAYHWFIWLGLQFQFATWLPSISGKIFMQQFVFVPVINTYFFGMQTLLSGGSLEDARQRVVDAVPVSWKNSWKLWPFVAAVNFTYIPPHYRSVFGAFFATVWQTYLSWVNQRAEAAEKSVGLKGQGAPA